MPCDVSTAIPTGDPEGVAAVFGGTTKSTKVPPSESRARGTAPPIQHLAGSQAKIAADLRV